MSETGEILGNIPKMGLGLTVGTVMAILPITMMIVVGLIMRRAVD